MGRLYVDGKHYGGQGEFVAKVEEVGVVHKSKPITQHFES